MAYIHESDSSAMRSVSSGLGGMTVMERQQKVTTRTKFKKGESGICMVCILIILGSALREEERVPRMCKMAGKLREKYKAV